jgi:hypothetical protein
MLCHAFEITRIKDFNGMVSKLAPSLVPPRITILLNVNMTDRYTLAITVALLTESSLTCRKRRVKCDEVQPHCKNCERVGRECVYPDKSTVSQRPRPLSACKSSDGLTRPAVRDVSASSASNDIIFGLTTAPTSRQTAGLVEASQVWSPFPAEQPEVPVNVLPEETFLLDDNLFAFDGTLTPNLGPVEWYDLLAEDAINSMQGQNIGNRWNFDVHSLSRRQSPQPPVALDTGSVAFDSADSQTVSMIHKPWNTVSSIELKVDELNYFEHFINVVAPILDLFDTGKHFASVVPHLALRNVGLLKSLLAVGACHMAIINHQSSDAETSMPTTSNTPASSSSALPGASSIAEQYYYETLQYISQNLVYQAYTTSYEILATATMISTYEVSEPQVKCIPFFVLH